jgi:hypothetical protein
MPHDNRHDETLEHYWRQHFQRNGTGRFGERRRQDRRHEEYSLRLNDDSKDSSYDWRPNQSDQRTDEASHDQRPAPPCEQISETAHSKSGDAKQK